MAFPAALLACLKACINLIVPADSDPDGCGFGADIYVLAQLSGDAATLADPIGSGLAELDRDALARYGTAFAALTADRQQVLLTERNGHDWFEALITLTNEGVYANPANGGNRDQAAWTMLGYRHGLPEGADGPARQAPNPPRRYGASGIHDYDAIVVGAGAGGGVAAFTLAEAGHSVLLLERGRDLDYLQNGHRDHLRNHRLAEYGHNTGPELTGNPRVFVGPDGSECITAPHEANYHNNAAGVGSGTFLYGGLAWRFHPDDFRMASRYGVPDGSSLTDWPIGYDDLAPYYDWAEWEIGVAGDGQGNRHDGPRRRGYPLPPVSQHEAAHVLARGAEALGLSTFAPPLLINTAPRDGRDACIECGSCVGFPCPSDSKNGTQNTVIPRALATGRVTLATGASVERIEVDGVGRVTGVTYRDTSAARVSVHAKIVVVSAGAIETARLLLLSGSAAHPAGLGNAHDQVGRNVQGHFYPTAFGLFDETVHSSHGPGVTIATCDFNHGNPGIIGGAMLADDFVMPPVIFHKQALPPDLPRWGAGTKAFMRDNFTRVTQVKGPVHEIPSPDCRVTLDPTVTDSIGRRVARLSGTTHPETIRTARYILDKAHQWLLASGAKTTWGAPPELRFSAGQHQAGTCRMGIDPRHSVTDATGRVWGHDNLFVADASLHPTNGGFNPVLTIMAMARRTAEHAASTIPR